ncbi:MULTISPECIES: hypothetical protein [Mycolicibacter]|uniref:DUF4149 domain-containing protein n=1 Tax=Mycolicibacter virginiensis TaxID=1795032 RepID=A0A9X7IJ36_9MYCO|nr:MULTISPECIES: hypothetical protein [Mycolicibacter]OBJ33282.1 hypothetical protein A5631_07525 [Mycolicibacter heraklionensis]PQM50145.1 hypothetical protein C5U48_21680 [Mycolicibacter virginiensis]ULP45866.1 hypothetical protein MJO54_13405 [Mycolicibacter virginiensis]
MSAGASVAIAATFVWLGMVTAISFMEAPLKFRAPNATIPICLGIGRLVFRALNSAEFLLAAVIAVTFAIERPTVGIAVTYAIALAMLAAQVLAVRPALGRRADQVLSGLEAPRSRAHYAYVALELVKVAALVPLGILLLSR